VASKRTEKRTQESLAKVLPPGTVVRAYAGGPAHARLSRLATGIIVTFAVAFIAIAVATGRILIPGALVLLFLAGSIKPYRGCAVTDRGVVLLGTRIENHQPKKVLAWLPFVVLFPPYIAAVGTKRVRVQLSTERVSLRTADYQRLVASIGAYEQVGAMSPPEGRQI